jgi:hypothetical protein
VDDEDAKENWEETEWLEDLEEGLEACVCALVFEGGSKYWDVGLWMNGDEEDDLDMSGAVGVVEGAVEEEAGIMAHDLRLFEINAAEMVLRKD